MSTGGAQRSLANISLELSRHCNVWLAVFNLTAPVVYSHGGELLNLDVIPGKSIVSKLLALRSRVNKLKRLKRNLNIDVSISFLEGADYVNVLSRQREKIVLSIRGSKIHDEIMKSSSFWLRSKILIPWLYRKADVIIPVSKGIEDELTTHYKLSANQIRVIGNFYDADQIVQQSAEPKNIQLEQLYEKNLVLVSTGRLNREKGLIYLIEIFAKLRQHTNNVKLVLVGDGPEKTHLLAQCAQLGLTAGVSETFTQMPDVIFVGNQTNVFKYLKNATLYVTNSSSEGFPNGIVEAMICGVTVVSSDCPYGPAEILTAGSNDDTFGVLLPIAKNNTTVDQWVNAISEILPDKERRAVITERAYARAQQFRKHDIINQWLNVIHE